MNAGAAEPAQDREARRRLGIGTAWIAASRIAVNLLGLVGTAVLARLLAPADFGLVAIATALMLVLNSLTELSVAAALVQRGELEPHHLDAAFTLNLLRAGAVALAMLVAAPVLAAIYAEPRLLRVMPCLAGGILATGLANPGLAALNRRLLFRQDFVLALAERLATLAAQLAGALLWHDYWALVWGYVAGPVARTLLSYRYAPHRPRLGRRGLSTFLGFSGWLGGAQLVNTLNWRLDSLLVGRLLGTGTLGFYAMGDTLAQLAPREAAAPILQTMLAGFARERGERARLRTAYLRAQALLVAVALPAGLGMVLVADPLVRLALGERWRPAIPIVEALAGIVALQAFAMLAQPLAMAMGDTRRLFWRDAVMFACRVPLVIAGLLLGGLPGLLAARMISGMIIVLISLRLARELTGLTARDQIAAGERSLGAAAAMVPAALAAQGTTAHALPGHLVLTLVATAGAAGGAYVATHLLAWQRAGRPDGPERMAVAALPC